MSTWTWATASWQERGEFIRSHLRGGHRPLSRDAVREVFRLTEYGLGKIGDYILELAAYYL